jgi:hypothetical protein
MTQWHEKPWYEPHERSDLPEATHRDVEAASSWHNLALVGRSFLNQLSLLLLCLFQELPVLHLLLL